MPGNSVFSGNVQTVNGVIKAENVALTFNNELTIGAVVQQAQWSCERTVNMLYEIGTQNVYYVGDRRRGTSQFSRVVAGSKNFKSAVVKYGDLCNAGENTMKLAAGSNNCTAGGVGGGTVSYLLLNVTLTNLGASVAANDIVVTENMGFMFADMEYDAT
jgi:hypothetical protein